MSTLLQQASLPLRSRRQAHQVRIAGVMWTEGTGSGRAPSTPVRRP